MLGRAGIELRPGNCIALKVAQFAMAQKEGAQLQKRTQLLVGVNLPGAFPGDDLDIALLPVGQLVHKETPPVGCFDGGDPLGHKLALDALGGHARAALPRR